MTVINTNVGALNARVAALGAQSGMEKAMQRLSSGLRINQAADDAAGLAVATKMESQLRGINMAIRNSNDGISLVQTAESGMGEISNMVIRMRELSVQMANGIYSDGDRANAQLEVQALLAEIDKIADNTNFNGVKVLDGSYSSEIRAGNTNSEIIGIAVDRMNTDALGGTAIATLTDAAVDTSNTFVHTRAKTNITAAEGQVQLNKDIFSSGFTEFVLSNGSGTYSMGSETDAGLFNVSSAGIVTLKAGELDFDNATDANFDGVYEFTVTYTNSAGTESVTEDIVLTITDTATKTASTNTATTTLTVQEAENVEFETVGASGVLSDAMKEFFAADTQNATSQFQLSGTDNALFSVNSTTGKINVNTGTFDFENAGDGNNDNAYVFTVTYTNAVGKTFAESVTLNVTNNAIADAAITQTDSELTTTGRTSIQVSSRGVADFQFDLTTAANRDLLSQGAKDFITRHSTGANTTLAAGDIFYAFDHTTLANVTPATGANVGTASSGIDAVDIATQGTPGTQHAIDATALDDISDATVTTRQVISFEDLSVANLVTGQITVDLTLSSNTSTSAAGVETFTETVVIDIIAAGSSGTDTFVQGAGRTEQSGASTIITGTSDGEEVVFDMRNRSLFADLNTYVDNNQGGTFSLGDGTGGTTNQTNADASTDEFSLSGNVLTLGTSHLSTFTATNNQAGAYTAEITYTDLDGNTFVQDITFNSTAATNPDTATVSLVSTDQTKDGVTQSTVVTGGKSTIQVNETQKATIQSTGGNSVLSGELTTFMNSYASGSWSLSGTDAASFEVDKNGDITSRTIMNFEDKPQYNFNLVYTSGSNVYTESIVLNVANDASDDGDHIENLNIGTQAGAQDAINILDTALNQITAAQAKLGSTQNRLQHNIDNLTAASSLTEQARGRITDADFALETSQLSKQQILSQAATSMLAQANQSKQSVLALLQ
jgi:flagellin